LTCSVPHWIGSPPGSVNLLEDLGCAFAGVGWDTRCTVFAANPIPIVVPCHRVVRGDGTLGGYLGGPDAKRALLELEGAI